MFRVLSLIVAALGLSLALSAEPAEAQCNVQQPRNDVSAASQLQALQLQQLLALNANRPAATATASAGGTSLSQQALNAARIRAGGAASLATASPGSRDTPETASLKAQVRALEAALSALDNPSDVSASAFSGGTQDVCFGGNCRGGSRVRAASRAVERPRPQLPRPRSRSVARSRSVSVA